jgi:nifR3 family TIM-barrel protein
MIRVGNVKIEGNIALSPMAGISDSPFRRITRKYGSAFSYTEFVSTDQIVLGNQKSIDMFRFQELERPIYFQIFGSDLNNVIEASKRIAHLSPDIIDLNMGCSVAKVSHNGSGAGLLRNLPLAGKMIEGIKKSVPFPVTAKIRLGWDENNLNYKETVNVLQDSGVSAISVHGRTKTMGYTGIANWDAIGEIKSFAKVPIFGNGDISSYEEAQGKIKKYGVDLVLVGRKAIGNPWIFSPYNKDNISFDEIRKVMIEHLRSMLEFYPSSDDYALILFRKHFVRYIHGIGFPEIAKRELLQTTSIEKFLMILLETDLGNKSKIDLISTEEKGLNCESYSVE